MYSVILSNSQKLYDVAADFNYEQKKDAKSIINLSKKHLKNDGFNLLNCLPYHLRDADAGRLETYRAAFPLPVPLFSVLSVRRRENIKELIFNFYEYRQDWQEFKGLKASNTGTFNSLINSFKWSISDFENLDSNNGAAYHYWDKIKHMTTSNYQKTIKLYKFDSYIFITSYELIIYFIDLRESGPASHVLLYPEEASQTTKRHLNELIRSLYNNDYLSGFIYNDFKYF